MHAAADGVDERHSVRVARRADLPHQGLHGSDMLLEQPVPLVPQEVRVAVHLRLLRPVATDKR